VEYKHFSLEERERLFALKEQGVSLREIGRQVGRSHSSVSRELKRNIKYGNEYFTNEYIPCKAQELYQKRAQKQREKAAWKGALVYTYVREKLKKKWSPETIAGRIGQEHGGVSICHETIYRMIYGKKYKHERLWEKLTLARKKRMKKEGRRVRRESRIPEAVSIDKRPKSVRNRTRVGHWETDNLGGPVTDKTALSVTVERKFRITYINKMREKTAREKNRVVFKRMAVLPEKVRKTITTDNGPENTKHQQLTASMGTPVYFCHPYASWEKPTVENMNGRIRRYIPKGTSIDSLTDEAIAVIEWELNTTPRKCLGWKTPYEKLQEYLIR
jgi:IS30 family transposase